MPQAPISEQVGHIVALEDGTFTQVGTNRFTEELKVPASQQAELRSLLGLRDGARLVLSLEASNVEDTGELVTERADLATKYKEYVQEYGAINRFGEKRTGRTEENGNDIMARTQPPVMATLRKDPYDPSVPALEYFDERTQSAAPAALLKERQVQPRKPIRGVDTPAEALAVTLRAARGSRPMPSTSGRSSTRLRPGCVGQYRFDDPQQVTGKLDQKPPTGRYRRPETVGTCQMPHQAL